MLEGQFEGLYGRCFTCIIILFVFECVCLITRSENDHRNHTNSELLIPTENDHKCVEVSLPVVTEFNNFISKFSIGRRHSLILFLMSIYLSNIASRKACIK